MPVIEKWTSNYVVSHKTIESSYGLGYMYITVFWAFLTMGKSKERTRREAVELLGAAVTSTSDCKRQLSQRHMLAGSGTDLMGQ
jgi:hypothetical protein